jgi:hypothetical protein
MTWEGFQELTADCKAKGFSVVQIVCGHYPDENFFAPSLENEGGQLYLAQDMSVVPHLMTANNDYKNPFGTEIALFRTVDGGTSRQAVAWDILTNGGELLKIPQYVL